MSKTNKIIVVVQSQSPGRGGIYLQRFIIIFSCWAVGKLPVVHFIQYIMCDNAPPPQNSLYVFFKLQNLCKIQSDAHLQY